MNKQISEIFDKFKVFFHCYESSMSKESEEVFSDKIKELESHEIYAHLYNLRVDLIKRFHESMQSQLGILRSQLSKLQSPALEARGRMSRLSYRIQYG